VTMQTTEEAGKGGGWRKGRGEANKQHTTRYHERHKPTHHAPVIGPCERHVVARLVELATGEGLGPAVGEVDGVVVVVVNSDDTLGAVCSTRKNANGVGPTPRPTPDPRTKARRGRQDDATPNLSSPPPSPSRPTPVRTS
jgi:hypothetical protein